jgi:predicted transcriptional regulator
MAAEQIRHAGDLLARPGNTVSSIARLLGVSRATIYKYLPELAGRSLPAGNRPLPDAAKHDQLLPSRPAAAISQHAGRG